MSYLASKLKDRIQFMQGINTPGANNQFERSYETILTCWGEVKNESRFMQAIRQESIDDTYTVEIKVRKSSVDRLGTEFSTAFSEAFDSIPDINPIKSEYFCFIEAGNSYKGRLFKVMGTRLDERNNEYVIVRLKEEEEHGTGGIE